MLLAHLLNKRTLFSLQMILIVGAVMMRGTSQEKTALTDDEREEGSGKSTSADTNYDYYAADETADLKADKAKKPDPILAKSIETTSSTTKPELATPKKEKIEAAANADIDNYDESYDEASEDQKDDDIYSKSDEKDLDTHEYIDDEKSASKNEKDEDMQQVLSTQTMTTHKSGRSKFLSIIKKPGILAGLVGGAIIGLLTAGLLILFIVYRMKKKDEGSYALEETKKPLNAYDYRHCPTKEFYA